MSGGSLNYLFCKEPAELFEYGRVEDLETAAAEAYNAGYRDVAKDIYRLAEYIKSAKIRVEVLHEQLKDVLKAIEWYISADYGADTLRKSLDAYRAGRPVEEAVKGKVIIVQTADGLVIQTETENDGNG